MADLCARASAGGATRFTCRLRTISKATLACPDANSSRAKMPVMTESVRMQVVLMMMVLSSHPTHSAHATDDLTAAASCVVVPNVDRHLIRNCMDVSLRPLLGWTISPACGSGVQTGTKSLLLLTRIFVSFSVLKRGHRGHALTTHTMVKPLVQSFSAPLK